jgi:hypothetical protein
MSTPKHMPTWRGEKGKAPPTKLSPLQRGMLFVDQEDDSLRDRASLAIREADASMVLAELAYWADVEIAIADVDIGAALNPFWFENDTDVYRPRFASPLNAAYKSQVKNVGAATYTGVGAAAATLSGTTADDPTADGDWVTLTTGAVSGDTASFTNPTTMNAQYRWAPTVSLTLRSPAVLTSCRLWCGMFSNVGTTQAADDPTVQGFGVRYSTAAPDTNWQLFRNDGAGGGAIEDSTVAVVANTVYGFILHVRPDTGDLELWVRESTAPFEYAFRASVTGGLNLPTSSSLVGYAGISTLTNATKTFRMGRWTQYHEM